VVAGTNPGKQEEELGLGSLLPSPLTGYDEVKLAPSASVVQLQDYGLWADQDLTASWGLTIKQWQMSS
jgi:hypothetical protein